MNIFRNKALIVFIILLVIGLIIYANSFNNQFFWDDDDSIVNNAYIKDWRYIPKFFSQNLIEGAGQTTNYWRPLVLLSFAVDYHAWGLTPAGFHLTNTILHILCAWLVFLFLCKLFEQLKEDKKLSSRDYFLSFLVSLFFLVHPLQTEAVVYTAGRADPLSSFFSLLVLIFYINFRIDKKITWFIFSILFFVLGLLTKEQVIFLPLLILLIELIFFIKKFAWKNIKKAAVYLSAFFTLSILYFVLRVTLLNFNDILGGVKNFSDSYGSLGVWERLLTFSSVMLGYFRLLFVPTGLHMAREVEPVLSVFSLPVISFVVLLAMIIFICLKTWKKNRMITFGFLWFFIILLPRTNIIRINRPMYEHWLYLPMIGFWLALFLLILLLINKIKEQSRKEIFETSFYTIALVICFIFCILTIFRNRDWRDPITFYEKNLRYTPESYIQHNNLGMAYAMVGANEKAITSYRKAIEIKDVYPQVHHNLANSLVSIQEIGEAIIEYRKAIEISPGFILPYEGLLNIYFATGQNGEIINLVEEMENVFADNPRFLQIKAEINRALGIKG